MIQNTQWFHITYRVHTVIWTNSYSLYSENMICDMITESDDTMRIFKKPIVNFSADDYYYLIDDNSLWLESILTKDISTAYLRSLDINNIGIFELGTTLVIQAVERHI